MIRTNAPGADGKPAKNYKLVTAPDGSTSRSAWQDWVPHRDDVFIDGFELFDGFTTGFASGVGVEPPQHQRHKPDQHQKRKIEVSGANQLLEFKFE